MRGKKIQKPPKKGKSNKEIHSASDHEEQHQKTPQVNEPKIVSKSVPKQKSTKGDTVKGKEVQLFSDRFNKHISDFKNFNREYLQMRAGKGDMDATSELKKVTESMGKKVENACLKVLKEELSEVQNWVEAEQQSLRKKIIGIQTAESENRKSLQNTGAFSKDQINQSVEVFQKKKSELEKSLNELESLKLRAVEMVNEYGSTSD